MIACRPVVGLVAILCLLAGCNVMLPGPTAFKGHGIVRTYAKSAPEAWTVLVGWIRLTGEPQSGRIIASNESKGWIIVELPSTWYRAAHDVYYIESAGPDRVRIEIVSRTPEVADSLKDNDPVRCNELHDRLARLLPRAE